MKTKTRKGPLVDVERWRKARAMQARGVSLLQIGLELEPPCAASVVWRGLRRLRVVETGNAEAQRLPADR